MYSKYLDYSEAAIKASHLHSAENDQKDIFINQLKGEVMSLRDLEVEYQKLNELIFTLAEKYELLQQEKDRSEKEQRIKSEIDHNTIIDLREEIDILRVNIQKGCLQIEELLRQNTLKKRMNDARLSEIQQINLEIKSVDNKNEQTHDQNRSLAISVKQLKEERKRLEEECDGLSALLDANISKLKNLEKMVRNNESVNAKLDKTLRQAENDHQKLLFELKNRNEDAKRSENKLRGITNLINESKITLSNVNGQVEKNKADNGLNRANLQNEIERGKELSAKLSATQSNIRTQEGELDQIIAQEEHQRKQHFINLDQHKHCNGELDRLLAIISEYELINKELIDEIEIYGDQDQQAISILNRREEMKELIATTLRKASATEQYIQHVKY